MTTQDQTTKELIIALQNDMLHRKACDYSFPLTRKKANYWASRITFILYCVACAITKYYTTLPVILILGIFGLFATLIYVFVYMYIYGLSGTQDRLYKNYINNIKSNPLELQKLTIQALQNSITYTNNQITDYENKIISIKEDIKNSSAKIDEYNNMLQHV